VQNALMPGGLFDLPNSAPSGNSRYPKQSTGDFFDIIWFSRNIEIAQNSSIFCQSVLSIATLSFSHSGGYELFH
jgi:hypothetical protein